MVNHMNEIKAKFHKAWKGILSESIFGIDTDEDIEYIIENLLMINKIDPYKFIANHAALLRGGGSSIRLFFGVEKDKTTCSMAYFVHPGHIAPAFPLWFYAAYPDVMVWFHEWQKEYVKAHNHNEDAIAIETAKLFQINAEDATVDKDQIVNNNDKYRPQVLRNLVSSYINITGKKLELQMASLKDCIIERLKE
jgi:hypothetical protein